MTWTSHHGPLTTVWLHHRALPASKLSDASRRLFWLTLCKTFRRIIAKSSFYDRLEGLSFPDVARRMSRTEDSVKNVWLRALSRLRRTLEDLR